LKLNPLLLQFVRMKWYVYVSGILFIAAANIIQSYFPKILGEFTDLLQKGGMSGFTIEHYSLLLAVIGVTYALLGGIGQFHFNFVGRYFEYVMRKKLFNHLTHMDERFYSKNGVGHLLSYILNDVTAVRESISRGVNQTTNAVMMLFSVVIMMSVNSVPLYLVACCIIPLLIIPVIVVRFGPIIRTRSFEVQESLGKMTEMVEEQIGGIRVAKKFVVGSIMSGRFAKTVDQVRNGQLRLIKVSSFFQSIIPFLGALSLVITIGFGGYMTIIHQITLGNFVALTLYIRLLVNPLQQIGNVINTMQRSRASLERIDELLGKKPDVVNQEHAVSQDIKEAGIYIHNLSFSYPEAANQSLTDINLKVKPGSTLGIVGKTGSGKTTLMKLLVRLYDSPAGTIFIGGKDISDMTLESLREQISYVPQQGFLFSTTIRDNIAFYRRDSKLASVEHAAKQAQIYSHIDELPDKFETKLGDRGVTLSGGQRQRIGLARGIIKNSSIMILDDSVSAVDTLTEHEIIEHLHAERTQKTTIITSHRISAMKYADLIIVMDEGRIIEQGSHSELLNLGGSYSSLHAIQQEGD
jgi:ATP-binding cassette subfamily B multidrug efflux pump